MWHISIIIFFVGLTLAYFNIKFSYWKRKEISFFPAKIPWGSFKNIMDNNIHQQFEAFYKYFRHIKVSYGGVYLFTSPILFLVDPALIKHILVKDFKYFSSRFSYHNVKDQKMSGHIYLANGYKWWKLTAKVQKVLSPPKIRRMLPTLLDSYLPLVGLLEFYEKEGMSVDTKRFVENITRDVVMNCVLGIDAHEDFKWFEDCILQKTRKEILLDHVRRMYPNLARYYGVLNYPKEAEDFFANTIMKYIEKRQHKSVAHTDFLDLFMEIYKHDHEANEIPEEVKLNMNDIINQCFFFYMHGFYASVRVLSFALYELARNQYVQNKIRTEIFYNAEKHHNIYGYEELNELKYLEQVLQEILRKYPPYPAIERRATRRYKLPGDKYVERGTNVIVSIVGTHKDEKYYPDPEKFKPERFTDKFKDKFEKESIYIPFGDGKRGCPGQRFAKIQLKVVLVMIIRNFQFFLTPGGTNPLESGMMLTFHKMKYNEQLSTMSCSYYN